MQVTLEIYKWTGISKEYRITSRCIVIAYMYYREWIMGNTRPIPIGTSSVIDTPTDDGSIGDSRSSLKHLSKGLRYVRPSTQKAPIKGTGKECLIQVLCVVIACTYKGE
jgi:hypothetical protein